MSFQQIINYDTPANFTFDDSKIEVTTLAKLKFIPKPNEHFIQDFSSSVGFTFDANKVEFNAGTLEQKDQTPLNSVFGCNFSVLDTGSGLDVKENWSGIVPTLTGSPTVTAGKLVCIGGANGALYSAAALGSTTGAVKFKYTPNYTGGPATNINVIALVNPANNNDRVILTNSPSGDNLRMTVSNASGVAVITATTIGGTFNFTAATEYEIELNFDNAAGTIRLFIDGALHGTLTPGAWTRGTSATTLVVGSTDKIYNIADGSFDDVIAYSAVQHTAAYTPGYVVPQTVYAETPVALPQFTYTGLGALDSFDALSTVEANAPGYVLNGLYWDGADWVASDSSFAQTSSLAEVNTNIATLPASNNLDVDVVFEASNDQATISNLDMGYSGQIYPTDNPSIVNNSAVFADSLDEFAALLTAMGNDGVTFQVLVNEIPKYFPGFAWVTATLGNIAESNTAAEIIANKGSLDLTNGRNLKFNAILHSDDGSTTPDITRLTVDYGFQGEIPATPVECQLYAYLTDIQADAKTGVLEIENKKTFSSNGTLVSANIQRVTFDGTGYIEISVIETETVGKKYNFRINYTDIDGVAKVSKLGDATVPNQSVANIADLF